MILFAATGRLLQALLGGGGRTRETRRMEVRDFGHPLFILKTMDIFEKLDLIGAIEPPESSRIEGTSTLSLCDGLFAESPLPTEEFKRKLVSLIQSEFLGIALAANLTIATNSGALDG
jgi:hypothetical protein